MSKFEIENAKYHIDDIKKDLEDVYVKNDIFSFHLIYSALLEECLETFYKIKRLPREKSKRLGKSIEKIDKKFKRVFEKAVSEVLVEEKYKSIRAVANHIEKMLGGKRSKEWKLIGKIDKSS